MSKEKIYRAFFNAKKEELYYNQLKELTSLSYSSLQNILKKMLTNNEITKNKTKSNVYYKLNYLKSIEFSKISMELLNSLNRDVRIPLKEFIKEVPKNIHSIVLFGSSSKNEETDNSDIDILIILESFDNKDLGETYCKEMKKKIKVKEIPTIYPFSLVYTTKNEFLKQNDFLLKEAMLTGFPILNQQKYYEEFE